MKKTIFTNDLEKAEARIMSFIREQFEKHSNTLSETKQDFDNQLTKFDKKIDDYRS